MSWGEAQWNDQIEGNGTSGRDGVKLAVPEVGDRAREKGGRKTQSGRDAFEQGLKEMEGISNPSRGVRANRNGFELQSLGLFL